MEITGKDIYSQNSSRELTETVQKLQIEQLETVFKVIYANLVVLSTCSCLLEDLLLLRNHKCKYCFRVLLALTYNTISTYKFY